MHVARSVESDSLVELSDLTPAVGRRSVKLVTERAFHVVDVTEDCFAFAGDVGIKEGVLSIYSPHTTCAVRINELETCFLEDLRLCMEGLVPQAAYYRHDDFEIRDPETLAGSADEEPLNGHSHVKHMLMGGSSETVPISDGALSLGRWQRVMFIELDQARPRTVNLQVQGWR
jgi:secondary thiamine-phosphate synthase enzyme